MLHRLPNHGHSCPIPLGRLRQGQVPKQRCQEDASETTTGSNVAAGNQPNHDRIIHRCRISEDITVMSSALEHCVP
eukprot:3418477-Amphidinium_carterae.1